MGDFLVAQTFEAPPRRLEALREEAIDQGFQITTLDGSTWIGVAGPRSPSLADVGDWLLIGDVIERGSPSLDPHLAGHEILERRWGRFVGVRRDGGGRLLAALRDPSGAIECVVAQEGSLTIVASAFPDWLLRRLDPEWSINWDRLIDALQDPLLVWDQLLLNGPVAVPPGGELLLRSSPRQCRRLWSPARIARSCARHRLKDAAAAQALEEAIDESVVGLASLGASVGAEISGGLDSGIVAAALKANAIPVVIWLHAFARDPESDERSYATSVAEHLALALTTRERTVKPFAESHLEDLSSGLRPGLNALDAHHVAEWAARWREAGAELIFSGKGGDSLFIQSAGGDVFTDLWLEKGLLAALDGALPGLARWNEVSTWRLLQKAAAYGRSRSPPTDAPSYLSVRDRPRRQHPWLTEAGDLGPAKRYQIAGVANGVMFSAPSTQTLVADLAHPLLSLPVVETCLSLSARQLTLGRRDRALAREAFRHRLPPKIVDRRSKGDMTRFYGLTVAASLPVLRPWLLDGALSQRGLIDREALGAALAPDRLILEGGYGEIMRLAAFESWVRRWETQRP